MLLAGLAWQLLFFSPTLLAWSVAWQRCRSGTSSAYAHYANEPSVGMQRVMVPPSRTVGSAVVETVSTQLNVNVTGVVSSGGLSDKRYRLG